MVAAGDFRSRGACGSGLARERGVHDTIQWFGRSVSPGGMGIFLVRRQRRDESTVFDWILFPGILLCAVRIDNPRASNGAG